MKKLLAIILAVVCIIPTMAVSFSVSAKAATNNVNSKDAFMYQYSEKTYTVRKLKHNRNISSIIQLAITKTIVLLL